MPQYYINIIKKLLTMYKMSREQNGSGQTRPESVKAIINI